MKFGRFLVENATPEWKRAYVDYRAAKKLIKRVQARLKQTPDPVRKPGDEDDDGDQSGGSSSGDDDHGPAKPRRVLDVSPRITSGVAVPPSNNSPVRTSGVKSGVVSGPGSEPESGSLAPPQPADPARSPSERKRVSSPQRATTSGAKKSPNYGAMGVSPRLTEASGFSTGFTYNAEAHRHTHSHSHGHGHVHHSHHRSAPPPLDLGEPSLAGSASGSGSGTGPALPPPRLEIRTGKSAGTGAGTDSSATLLDADDPAERNRERMARIARTGRAPAVNFSPAVEAISPAPAPSSAGAADDEASSDSTKQSPNLETSSTLGKSLSMPSPSIGKPHRRQNSGFSPLLSLISSRVQPSAGVSPSGVADAPSGNRSIRSLHLPSPRIQPRTARTFDELYETLQPDEKAFFDLLDHELEKVENFYSAREGEATRRSQQLRDQLRELAEHRRIFHEVFPEGIPDWEAAMGRMLPVPAQKPIMRAAVHLRRNPFAAPSDDDSRLAASRSSTPRPITPLTAGSTANGNGGSGFGAHSRAGSFNGDPKTLREDERTRIAKQYDPDRYQKSKKELRNAMLEFYRHLELIKNYRILNLTGFRKALKKFEKATHIQCLELYTEDRIATCSFSRGETIDSLIKQSEDLFTEHFEHGDGKRARNKLRQQDMPVTHYLTVFRSGIMLGLGAPAAILAIVKSFDPQTRDAILQHGALLQVYAALYMPVVFAMLFELNLQAWVEARINYEFVMELERPSLDYRSFFEIPAFLFLTLSYCFFFSFYRVATHSVAPTTWPAGWLVMVAAFFLNPLPIFRRRSRYWLLKVLFRVCTPGYSRVEFIAFFVADELNSLVFSIQNVMFLSCAYGNNWPDDPYAVCPSGRTWPYALLACLPPLARLVQCLKRYKDSNLVIHLINAGKYCSSIITACMFVWWRSHGSPHDHASFGFWIVFATIASIYTSAWDLVVDWSLLRPHYKLLRPDLGYSHKSVYYCAMVTNILIRFIWVWYLPARLQHTHMRSWIFATCEMLRRWQWNFFRVETEHLGNADAYRVTREVPLPYRQQNDSDDDPKDMRRVGDHPVAQKLRQIHLSLVGKDTAGRGPDALNVGARGHAAQREYEARRPGDSGPRSSDDSAV